MKRLAVLGASYLQRDLVVKAAQMGFEVHAFAWSEGEVVSDVCHQFHNISLTDTHALVSACREIGVDGVVTSSSDVAVPAMAEIATQLNLVGPSLETARCCTHKGAMREALANGGCAIPDFVVMTEWEEAMPFSPPFVVKASDRSGSRGVTVVREEKDWRHAFEEAQRVSFSKDVVVEQFFKGRQFSVEAVSQGGCHYFCGLTEEFFGGQANCEKGHLVPGRLSSEETESMFVEVKRALDALGVRDGASHSEIRINQKGELCIVEVGARLGGDFRNRLVFQAYGVDLDELVIKIALGRAIEDPMAQARHSAMISWVFDKADAEAFKTAVSEDQCVYHEILRPVSSLQPKSSNERYGYVIVSTSINGGGEWIESELKRNSW